MSHHLARAAQSAAQGQPRVSRHTKLRPLAVRGCVARRSACCRCALLGGLHRARGVREASGAHDRAVKHTHTRAVGEPVARTPVQGHALEQQQHRVPVDPQRHTVGLKAVAHQRAGAEGRGGAQIMRRRRVRVPRAQLEYRHRPVPAARPHLKLAVSFGRCGCFDTRASSTALKYGPSCGWSTPTERKSRSPGSLARSCLQRGVAGVRRAPTMVACYAPPPPPTHHVLCMSISCTARRGVPARLSERAGRGPCGAVPPPHSSPARRAAPWAPLRPRACAQRMRMLVCSGSHRADRKRLPLHLKQKVTRSPHGVLVTCACTRENSVGQGAPPAGPPPPPPWPRALLALRRCTAPPRCPLRCSSSRR